jgi:hypothetical protein
MNYIIIIIIIAILKLVKQFSSYTFILTLLNK